jgi:hypothetical protein
MKNFIAIFGFLAVLGSRVYSLPVPEQNGG